MNHHSALQSIKAKKLTDDISLIGIDGIFLKKLLDAKQERTSADLFIPKLLAQKIFKVALVGGKASELALIRKAFEEKFPNQVIAYQIDGYSGIQNLDWVDALKNTRPNLILLGLGAPLQDEAADLLTKAFSSCNEKIAVLTCGGFLDQIQNPSYYPTIAYSLKINWLIRLSREPRRLWKRYSIEAIYAVVIRKRLKNEISSLDGYLKAESISLNLDVLIKLILKDNFSVH